MCVWGGIAPLNRVGRSVRGKAEEGGGGMGRDHGAAEGAVAVATTVAEEAGKTGLGKLVLQGLGKLSKVFGAGRANAATAPRKAQPNWVGDLIYLSATLLGSFFFLKFTLAQLDPNKAASKQAAQRKKEIKQRLGRTVQTNTYEDVIACDVINPDHLSVSFDKIGGLNAIKERLYELVILPLRRPDLFARGNLLKPVKGVLLYGPPGTGKTMLAKAIAKESNACFINVRAATLQSKWFGDAQKLVTAVFTLAMKLQPSIIFIDEIDSMLGKRHSNEHEATNNMKTEFMALWDGFTTDEYSQVMVLGATNRPWEVDEAVLRRLPQSFLVGLPDQKQRESILSKMLEGEVMDESVYAGQGIRKLGEKTSGFSGSDLKQLCTNAAYYPIRELLQAERKNPSAVGTMRPRSLTLDDFVKALAHSKPTGEQALKYMRTKVMENAMYQGLGMVDLEAEDDDEDVDQGDDGVGSFDPLGRWRRSKK